MKSKFRHENILRAKKRHEADGENEGDEIQFSKKINWIRFLIISLRKYLSEEAIEK